MKTIKLQGKDYIQVDERLKYFNAEHPNGRVVTEPTFNENTVYFKAMVTPDLENMDRVFTGHSFGVLGKEKALERLETVAVGRALAMMGIGLVGGIASADEMEKFKDNPSTEPVTGLKVPAVEDQTKLAKDGNLMCSDCASEIPYAEYVRGAKAGQPKLECPKYNWKNQKEHVTFISKLDKDKAVKEIRKDVPFETKQ